MTDNAKQIRNERLKLLANYLNGLAIATFAVGGLAPLIAAATSNNAPSWPAVMISVICISTSVGLHLAGNRLLKGLAE